MDQKAVIELLQRFKLLLIQHYDLKALYLYGSYSRGNQHEDSDIDVAVVVNSFSGNYLKNLSFLWGLRQQIDTRIEPVFLITGKDPAGFLDEIYATGIEIK
jgi:predicted nucleotidyltransferase